HGDDLGPGVDHGDLPGLQPGPGRDAGDLVGQAGRPGGGAFQRPLAPGTHLAVGGPRGGEQGGVAGEVGGDDLAQAGAQLLAAGAGLGPGGDERGEAHVRSIRSASRGFSAAAQARTRPYRSSSWSWLSLNRLCTARTRTRKATTPGSSVRNRSREAGVGSQEGVRSDSSAVTVRSTTPSVSESSPSSSSVPVTWTAA